MSEARHPPHSEEFSRGRRTASSPSKEQNLLPVWRTVATGEPVFRLDML
jgi:hypothetical protein